MFGVLQEKFLSFVDLFQKENVKISAAKIIVEAFCKYVYECYTNKLIINYCTLTRPCPWYLVLAIKQLNTGKCPLSVYAALNSFFPILTLTFVTKYSVGSSLIMNEVELDLPWISAFRYQMESVSDPVITSTIMYMCKILHDSVK